MKDSALQTEAWWLSLGHYWVTSGLLPLGTPFLVCTGDIVAVPHCEDVWATPRMGERGRAVHRSWAGGICARLQVS